MTDLVLTFQNASDAVAGERKLLDAGVDVRMMPAPKAIGPGCGICLVVNSVDIGKVRLLLAGSIRGICREGETAVTPIT
jgi:hypothetical protein